WGNVKGLSRHFVDSLDGAFDGGRSIEEIWQARFLEPIVSSRFQTTKDFERLADGLIGAMNILRSEPIGADLSSTRLINSELNQEYFKGLILLKALITETFYANQIRFAGTPPLYRYKNASAPMKCSGED